MTLSEFYRSPLYHGPYGGNVASVVSKIEGERPMTYTGSNQREPEFHTWATLVRGMGAESYVELGVGSAWSIRDAGISNIVTVDLLPNGMPGIPHIQGDSHDTNTRAVVLLALGCDPDVVFIDADHTYEGCKADFEAWYKFARMAVGFHDIYLADGCDRFWNEVSQQYPSVEIRGRDLASATKWQNSVGDEGRLRMGGVGVIWKI